MLEQCLLLKALQKITLYSALAKCPATAHRNQHSAIVTGESDNKDV